MKLTAFTQLVEETRKELCQCKSTLRFVMPELDGPPENISKAINGLGNMLDEIYVAQGFEKHISPYDPKSYIAAPKNYRPMVSDDSKLTDVLSTLMNKRDLVHKFNQKEHARKYKSLIDNTNKRVKLSKKYFGQQRSTFTNLKKAVIALEDVIEAREQGE